MKWLLTARPNQLPPPEDDTWDVWFLMAGRGFGKTRTAVEDIVNYTCFNDGVRYGTIAATLGDLRKITFEGESGIMACMPKEMIKGGDYNKSKFELELENGSLIQGFSADKPDRLRGPQFHRAHCDEIASWRYPDAWEMLEFCLRLGDMPKCIISSTPKPTKLVKEIANDYRTVISTGSTYENQANLAKGFLNRVKRRYEGTRLGQQELSGLLLDEIEGALWSRNVIHYIREEKLPNLLRVVVGVDPAVTANPDSDETGIVVAAKGDDGRYYVLGDFSGILPVGGKGGWPARAVNAYHKFRGDKLVGEQNNGGDLVERAIKLEDPKVNYKKVTASRGKVVRAEPIAGLYEKGLVSHVGAFGTLEDQMCTFAPATLDSSPDRVDALVWALTELADTAETELRIR